MTAPFWLIVYVWIGGQAVGVTAVPMPSREVCEAAVDNMPGSFSYTPARAFCIVGMTEEAKE